MTGARPSDRAGAPVELSPQTVSSKAAHPSRGGFTPGPWNLERCSLTEEWFVAVGAYPLGKNLAECIAEEVNARLIAAAPELYRDLETALALVRIEYGNLDEDVNRFFERATATLAKARGEQGQ